MMFVGTYFLPLLDGTVDLDVNNIANTVYPIQSVFARSYSQLPKTFQTRVHEPVRLEVRVEGDHALLAKVAAEGILIRR
jgi:hypothetical protein